MFGTGFPELILIFVIALLILGPERLPRVAAQLGRWIGKARRTANQLRYQLEREVALDEVYRSQKKKPPRPGTPPAGTPPSSGTDAAADSPAEPGHSAAETVRSEPAPAAGNEPIVAAAQPAADEPIVGPARPAADEAVEADPPRQTTSAR
jgi:sec-independent protein translocase protein TatB